MAVKGSGHALEWADASLRADRQVVMQAVTTNGEALEFADAGLRSDSDIVLAAMKEYVVALELAGDYIHNDSSLASQLIGQLPATTLEVTQFFRITAMSGRSLIFVIPDVDMYPNVPDTLHDVLWESGVRLGLGGRHVRENGELLDATTLSSIKDDDALSAYPAGKLHEL
eukprot:CAMPEP_0178409758 /NCGR_PEP_ID=MMETSP0689_2-20121128/20624_1 /TAXON_ID=160604 /ORGANISM="Amphidinium massartii, Strain CS-259" /LENGTH=169 /DNA_ID=CAMNT_0020030903 /DNA_START=123 /DNA_END=629 /DNA_ORIENTATION=+